MKTLAVFNAVMFILNFALYALMFARARRESRNRARPHLRPRQTEVPTRHSEAVAEVLRGRT